MPSAEKETIESENPNSSISFPLLVNGVKVADVTSERISPNHPHRMYSINIKNFQVAVRDENGVHAGGISVTAEPLSNFLSTIQSKLNDMGNEKSSRLGFNGAEDLLDYVKAMVKNNGDWNCDDVTKITDKRADNLRKELVFESAVGVLNGGRYWQFEGADNVYTRQELYKQEMGILDSIETHESLRGKIMPNNELTALIESGDIYFGERKPMNDLANERKSEATMWSDCESEMKGMKHSTADIKLDKEKALKLKTLSNDLKHFYNEENSSPNQLALVNAICGYLDNIYYHHTPMEYMNATKTLNQHKDEIGQQITGITAGGEAQKCRSTIDSLKHLSSEIGTVIGTEIADTMEKAMNVKISESNQENSPSAEQEKQR